MQKRFMNVRYLAAADGRQQYKQMENKLETHVYNVQKLKKLCIYVVAEATVKLKLTNETKNKKNPYFRLPRRYNTLHRCNVLANICTKYVQKRMGIFVFFFLIFIYLFILMLSFQPHYLIKNNLQVELRILKINLKKNYFFAYSSILNVHIFEHICRSLILIQKIVSEV